MNRERSRLTAWALPSTTTRWPPRIREGIEASDRSSRRAKTVSTARHPAVALQADCRASVGATCSARLPRNIGRAANRGTIQIRCHAGLRSRCWIAEWSRVSVSINYW